MLLDVYRLADYRVILPAHLAEEEAHDVCVQCVEGKDGQLRRQMSELFSTRGSI